MRCTRIAFTGLLVAGLSLTIAMAQQPVRPQAGLHGGGGHQGEMQNHPLNPDEQLKHLTKALNLTADQQAQIKPLITDRDQQITTLRADTTGDRKANMIKMRSLNQDFESKMQTILTDDQKQKYIQLKEEHRQKEEERRAQGKQQNGASPAPVAPATTPATPPAGL